MPTPDSGSPPGVADPPLAGLRVLDLSRILAGPWATQLLADLGADVVKVERPGTGDDTRGWGPPFIERAADPSGTDGRATERAAAYYHAANRSKRSVAIDIASDEGAARLRGLLARADVVVENFRTGGLEALGFGEEDLRAINPRLVVCSITGFGRDGPRAAEPGYDAMIQAMSGFMSVTGEPDGMPQKIGVALMDVLAGLYAANAIQAALWRRERTGRGERIDVALFDVALASLANQALNFLATGEAPGRLGTAHPNIVPYQAFACLDGHVMLAVGNDAQFARLCGALGRDDLATDPRFATNADRVAHREALVPILEKALARRPLDDLLLALEAARVPAGPINTLERAFADPQAIARGLRLDMGGMPGVRCPIRFAEARTAPSRPAPRLGEHDGDVADDPGWS